jgi:hypothetical protein
MCSMGEELGRNYYATNVNINGVVIDLRNNYKIINDKVEVFTIPEPYIMDDNVTNAPLCTCDAVRHIIYYVKPDKTFYVDIYTKAFISDCMAITKAEQSF